MLLGLLAAIVALAASCSTVRAFTDLDSALTDAGFTSTQVSVGGSDPVTLTVSADAPAGDSTEEAQDAAAQVVWESFPRRFEQARITIDGEERTVTPTELRERFGDRPAGLDEHGDLGDDVTRLSIGLIVGILVAGVVVVALIAVVAVVVVRRRRRAAGPRPGGPEVPWAPPPGLGGTPAAPVPPTGGWGPPVGGTPQPPGGGAGPGGSSPPPSTPPLAPPAEPPSAQPDVVPEAPDPTPESRADARRKGRRVPGPRPPASQIPPGWG